MIWCTVKDIGHRRCFKVEEVKHAISTLNRRRAIGPDEIPVKFRKSTDKEGRKWLTGLLSVILKKTNARQREMENNGSTVQEQG